MNIGPTEAIIGLVIILVLFGGSQLPKLARNLGKAQKEFKDGIDEGQRDPSTSTATATESRRETNTSINPTTPSTGDPARRDEPGTV